jgi:hypothetical protein
MQSSADPAILNVRLADDPAGDAIHKSPCFPLAKLGEHPLDS